MDYDLAPCPYCALENARLKRFDDRNTEGNCLVAVFCSGCGARGPVRHISPFADVDAVMALAADDWEMAGRIECRLDDQVVAVGLGDTIQRIRDSVEPATEAQAVPPGPQPDSNQAEDEASADPPQVPEAAGGGGGEGATPNTPERPAIETESNAPDVTGPTSGAQPCPDPANNGAGRGGAATEKTITERVREFLEKTGWTAKDFAHHIECRVADVTRLINGNAGRNHPVRAAAKAFLDSRPTVSVKGKSGPKVEVLPNNYDKLKSGNPLPKHEPPARCSRTP